MLVFIIGVPPQGKKRHRMSAGRAYSDPNMVRFEHDIREAAKAAMQGKEHGAAVPVELQIEYRFPIPESWSSVMREEALAGIRRPTVKPDMDNIEKAVCDGCNGILWKDDCYIVDCHHEKWYALEPCTVVTVNWLPDVKTAQEK